MAVRENPTKSKVAELEQEGKSAKEIAAALDISTATVYNQLRALHPDKPRKRGRPPLSDEEKAARAAAKGQPSPKAAVAKAKGEAPKRRGRPPKSATPAPVAAAEDHGNGNGGVDVDLPELRAEIKHLIEVKQAELAKLKEMLALTK